jgi:hypothetical protein
MNTITIAIADDVAEGLEQLRKDQEPALELETLANTAIREYLIQRGYLPSHRVLRITPAQRPLRITPFDRDDVPTDLSVEHDKYLAEWPE